MEKGKVPVVLPENVSVTYHFLVRPLQTISFTLKGVAYHIVSYFTEEDLLSGRLLRASKLYDLQHIVITPTMLRPSDFRHPPPVHTEADGASYM